MKKHFSVYWYMYLLGAILVFMFVCYCKLIDMVDESANEMVSTYYLIDIESENITAISYRGNQGQEISFARKEDGSWMYAPDESLVIEQTSPQYLAELLKEVTSEYQVEDVEDFDMYGLSEDSPYVEISTESETYRIYIGNFNETVKRYYAYIDGKDTVYGLKQDIAEVLDFTLNNYLKDGKK